MFNCVRLTKFIASSITEANQTIGVRLGSIAERSIRYPGKLINKRESEVRKLCVLDDLNVKICERKVLRTKHDRRQAPVAS